MRSLTVQQDVEMYFFDYLQFLIYIDTVLPRTLGLWTNILELYSQSSSKIASHPSYQVKTLLNFVSPTPMAPGQRPSLHGKVLVQLQLPNDCNAPH